MKNAEDLIQTWGFEGDTIVFKDASLGSIYSLSGINGENLSDNELNSIKVKAAKFLGALPENLDLQFIFEVTEDSKDQLKLHEELATNSTPEIISLTNERIKRYERIQSPRYKIHLIIREQSQYKLKAPSVFSIWKSDLESSLQSEFLLSNTKHEKTCRDILDNLRPLGITGRRLNQRECFDEIFHQWNPARESPKDFDPEDLTRTIPQTDIAIDLQGFCIGEMEHRVLSVKSFPDHTISGLSSILTSMPVGAKIYVSIKVPDQIKEIARLKTDRRVAYAMVFGKRAGVRDLDSEAKFTELENLLEQLISRGEKIFHVSVNAVLRSKNTEQLERLTHDTINAFRLMNGTEAIWETFPALQVFRDLAVPNAKSPERARKLKTSNLSDLLPLFTPWEGSTRPVVLFKNAATRSVFSFDPFDSTHTNYNALISGGSGAGKSYLTNFILLQALAENPYLYFVDIGGSYKKLAENLGGAYIPLSLDSGVVINPFDLSKGETAPSDQKIKFLVGLVEIMTKEEEVTHLPRLLRSEIELAIRDVYKKSSSPTLSDLQKTLSTHANPDLVNISKVLSTWCGHSAYGKFLDQKSTVSLETKITAFDLKGLEQFPDLQSVALYIVTDLIWRKVEELKSYKKYVIFDECWRLLKTEAGIALVEDAFRTFRKLGASAIAISQDIDDFAKSKISTAILPNCSMKWIMMQPQADGERLKELLNLNENEVETIQGLAQDKGVYSEVYLIAQDKKAHLRIEASPLEYWISTTDPADLLVLLDFEFENKDMSKIEALKTLSTLYPQGVAAAKSKNTQSPKSNVIPFPNLKGESHEKV